MSSRSALIALLALAPLAGCGSDADSRRGASGAQAAAAVEESAPPRPDRPLPRDPKLLAERLRETRHSLHLAIDRWLAEGGPRERAPREVKLYALDHHRIYGLMTRRGRLARAVLDRVRGSVAAEARDVLEARRELSSLATPVPARRIRTGKARPAGVLLRFYRKAERRFEVPWKLLAAVNFVESAFGKVRNKSTAGAQGPMQFIPSTWEAYGMGGDVHDPHDAIMGAANYLHASGAPQNIRGALYAYNPSRAYVDAVLSYTRQIRRDRHTYYAFYSWQVFVRTPSGLVQLTGPGADR
jgi:soluble lytic murein transglycosylase-like protein